MANLKNIPPIDEILAQRPVLEMIEKHNRDFVVRIIRKAVEDTRQELRSSQNDLEREQIMGLVIEKMRQTAAAQSQGSLKRVINGTGVVLHTNLGRAPLGERALHYMSEMARNYNNLEMNLEKGQRGSRYDHVEDLLRELTGAEAALVVNNNAAAVLLGLSTLADQREVIVSRGQLVEIGGAFRIPEVMKLSGARLVEVGTTNKTYISDFAAAINENTALLFAAHTSNYKIIGFTAEVELAELVRLGQEKGIAVMQDLGSGILYRSPSWKLGEEPTVQECLAAGTDIITFSGDKLLGGPQAGIIIGKKVYIEAMKKNQLTRALRVDKLTIAALEGTLLEYLNGKPDQNIPVIRMLEYSLEDLEERAEKLYMTLETRIRTHKYIEKLSLIRLDDMVGGGAYPTYLVPGYGLEIRFKGISLENAAQRLRLMNRL
ncbi:L-seryl-tRNA(Sec) selenium transferase [Syntrophomonas palmitatica]|uniref:L-seryl-tRNA(Sec) selenium transferase n=1 Tax=Syntrophomonas palmitatica TaxID=402877 RepID=UPI000A61C579|nr:L-seryl-tRNA(Sec) selenium transferase [Syntrophomonas palmitatica]